MSRLPTFVPRSRRPVPSDPAKLVTFGSLECSRPQGCELPLLGTPAVCGVDLCSWVASERAEVDAALLRHGGILFRNFEITSTEQFRQFVTSASDAPLPYVERSSPRTAVGGHIYSSTDYPPEHEIFPHCENSYQDSRPL